MKRILLQFMFLAVIVPVTSLAGTIFTDNFSNGSTLNMPSEPNTYFTSYDIASSKDGLDPTAIAPNDLHLALNSGTTAGFLEAQALFTTTPITLATIGNTLSISVVFTNTIGTLLSGDTSKSYIWVGLYYSDASIPVYDGLLADGGLNGTNNSPFATENCANWVGYVAQISSNGISELMTRPIQNGGATTSANQELVGNGVGVGTYNNPIGAAIVKGTSPLLTLVSNAPYTLSFTVTRNTTNTLSISDGLYAGNGTGGPILFSQAGTVSGTNFITSAFDGFAIGTRYAANTSTASNGTPGIPVMDISSISITGQGTTGALSPTFISQPISQTSPVGSNITFSVTVDGTFPMNYRWQFNGVPISGATNQDFVLTNLLVLNSGNYSVIVSNPYGSVTSTAASLDVFDILQTAQVPTTAESMPAYLISPPPPSQLMAYCGGNFTTNLASVDPNQMTIVLTHGWIPTFPGILPPSGGVDGWPAATAAELRANGVTSANIVAWNWTNAATSSVFSPETAGSQTPANGSALGQALLAQLGPQYSQKIQFIGHSFGTLVNAYAANFLQGKNWAGEAISPTPWPANNMLMTLFDEAEIGTDKGFNSYSWNGIEDLTSLGYALASGDPNFVNSAPAYYHPLPQQFAWAENYISAFGLLHTNAVNVILTNGLPVAASGFLSLFNEFVNFHSYPIAWYQQTIQNDNSAMGFVWPFLWLLNNPSFANAPTTDSIYLQAYKNSNWDLIQTNWNFGTNWLGTRFQEYRNSLGETTAQFAGNTLLVSGEVIGAMVPGGILTEWEIGLYTSSAGSSAPLFEAKPAGSSGNEIGTNTPAYAWAQLVIPTNAISMSFNYIVQGDWQDDALAVALNGTNVLFLPGNDIETNMIFNSGAIDVMAYAGKTNEFFVGIVGGTSTNAQLAINNISFSIPISPMLQGHPTGGSMALSWPLSPQIFNLQTTTNLIDPNSWITLTNIPVIVDLQNVTTNPSTSSWQFYRLISQ